MAYIVPSPRCLFHPVGLNSVHVRMLKKETTTKNQCVSTTQHRSQGIRGCVSVMATLKLRVLLKIIADLLDWRYGYSLLPLEYLIKKSRVMPTHEASEVSHYGQIMQCIITCSAVMYSWLSDIWICNFGHPLSWHSIYVSKDLKTRGYFSKLKGARERKILGNTGLVHSRE